MHSSELSCFGWIRRVRLKIILHCKDCGVSQTVSFLAFVDHIILSCESWVFHATQSPTILDWGSSNGKCKCKQSLLDSLRSLQVASAHCTCCACWNAPTKFKKTLTPPLAWQTVRDTIVHCYFWLPCGYQLKDAGSRWTAKGLTGFICPSGHQPPRPLYSSHIQVNQIRWASSAGFVGFGLSSSDSWP